jgi:lysozyme
MRDIAVSEKLVLNNVKIQLSQNQFDALVSIVYNVGPGSKTKDGIIRLKSGVPSTLLKKINNNDFVGAGQEFLKWCRADGIIMSGLERRREAERQLFLTK